MPISKIHDQAPQGKIVLLDEIGEVLAGHRERGEVVVQCHGVFDLVHPGHIRHLNAAAREGDVLVVSITADRFVNKGPGRPVFNSRLRAETLAALECVDFVTVNDAQTAIPAIETISPDVYVKGDEYSEANNDITGKISVEVKTVELAGGRVHFTNEITMSSSELINAHFDVYRPETRGWLTELCEKYSIQELVGRLDQLRSIKVLVVGEAIIDEYHYCEGLGRSSKDPLLAFKLRTSQTFAGGSLVVANHLAGLCDDVTLLTVLGDGDQDHDFARNRLQPNVRLKAVNRPKCPTIRKSRYVDDHTGVKLFELYQLENSPISGHTADTLLEWLSEFVADYDLVVVADYGHGMLIPELVNQLITSAKFLAVNTQSNAGNRGFNTISKYSSADYVCLNGGELELEVRQKQLGLQDLILEAAERIECQRFTITQGRNGSIHYEVGKGFTEAPALAVNIADRVGAGDAVLAVTSPMVALGMPWDLISFFANLAGAEVVAEHGTRLSLDRTMLARHAQSILQ